MRKTAHHTGLSSLLCAVLIAAMALMTAACGDTQTTPAEDTAGQTGAAQETAPAEPTSLGEGETTFSLTVTDPDGQETAYEIHTDKTTVGEALLELGLIAGEESEYGLYVKEVGGITADYDADGSYWAFYIDGEYASAGVDATEIVAGSVYELRVEKG